MKIDVLKICVCAAALALCPGCMTEAELRADRIREHNATFVQLPGDVQARVSQGIVAVGDCKTAVWFAFGEPDNSVTQADASGVTEVWQYMRSVPQDYEVLVDDPPPPPPPPPPPGAKPHHSPPHAPRYIRTQHWETRTRWVEEVARQFCFKNELVTSYTYY